MRYQRNVRIFRGGVDAAPFAGLFFVVIMFVLLFHSHVFIPGVPVRLVDEEEAVPEMTTRSVKVLRSGEVQFLGRSVDIAEMKEEIKSRSQKGTLPQRVLLEAESSASRALTDRVEDALQAAGVSIKYPGNRMDLPEDAGFTGTPNPVIVVGMNLNGQIFFEHQLIQESALQQKLTEARGKAGEKMVMVLQVDARVPAERITRLAEIARRADVNEVLIATRPPA